jgi:hypothetical protein
VKREGSRESSACNALLCTEDAAMQNANAKAFFFQGMERFRSLLL